MEYIKSYGILLKHHGIPWKLHWVSVVMICGSLHVTCVLEVFSLMSETAHTSSTSDGGSVDADR